jgi:pyruvate, water dikinase
MAEIPSNIILAEEFAERFDGFSIGSNDLTQLTLGVDRDSRCWPPVRRARPGGGAQHRALIDTAHAPTATRSGLCGQAAERRPRVRGVPGRPGIDSISVSPDSFLDVKQHIAAAEPALHPPSASSSPMYPHPATATRPVPSAGSR